jgi:iron complex outermembrane receptor protein
MIASMKKNHSLLFLAVALLATNGSQTSALAAEAYDLPEVVVTATRTDREVEKIPSYVQIVTAEEIRESGAKSVPEALKSLSGISVSSNNRDIIDISGFGEAAKMNVAVLVDGRKLNPIDMSGPNWGSIPLANIERIEVVHGAGTVMYGDNAMGGVINIITKKPASGTSVTADVSGGSYGTFKTDGSITIGNEKLSLLVGGTHYTTDGYRDHSEERRDGIYSRFQGKASDRLLFKADFSNTYDTYNLPGYLTEAQIAVDRRQVNPSSTNEWADSRLTQLGGGVEYDLIESGKVFLDVSYLLEKKFYQSSPTYFTSTDMATKMLSPKYVLNHALGAHTNRLTVGADYQVMDFEAFTSSYWNGWSHTFANYDRKSFAAYLQDEFGITEKLLLSLGYRCEDMASDFAGSSTPAESGATQWAGEAGLVYNYLPNSKIYGKISRSYRFPAADEMYSYYNGAFSALQPSRSVNYEAGLSYVQDSGITLNFRGYRMDVNDEILFDGLEGSFGSNINYPKTRHMGSDLDIRYALVDDMVLFCGVSYTDAEYAVGEYDGKQLPMVPAWKGNLGAELDFGHGLHSRVTYTHVGEQYKINDPSNTQSRLADYGTVDLALSYAMRHVDLYFNATNIFNEKYCSYAAYSTGGNYGTLGLYPMPEAQYTIGMRVKF